MSLCVCVCVCVYICKCVQVHTAAETRTVVMFSEDVCSFTQWGKTKQQTTVTISLNRGNGLHSSTSSPHSLCVLSTWSWLVVVFVLCCCVCVVIWCSQMLCLAGKNKEHVCACTRTPAYNHKFWHLWKRKLMKAQHTQREWALYPNHSLIPLVYSWARHHRDETVTHNQIVRSYVVMQTACLKNSHHVWQMCSLWLHQQLDSQILLWLLLYCKCAVCLWFFSVKLWGSLGVCYWCHRIAILLPLLSGTAEMLDKTIGILFKRMSH